MVETAKVPTQMGLYTVSIRYDAHPFLTELAVGKKLQHNQRVCIDDSERGVMIDLIPVNYPKGVKLQYRQMWSSCRTDQIDRLREEIREVTNGAILVSCISASDDGFPEIYLTGNFEAAQQMGISKNYLKKLVAKQMPFALHSALKLAGGSKNRID